MRIFERGTPDSGPSTKTYAWYIILNHFKNNHNDLNYGLLINAVDNATYFAFVGTVNNIDHSASFHKSLKRLK